MKRKLESPGRICLYATGISLLLVLATLRLAAQCPIWVHSPEHRISAVQIDIGTLEAAARLYRLDHGHYPTSIDVLIEKEYFERLHSKDPWGNRYVVTTGPGVPIVYSPGPNGIAEGGAGDDVTIEDRDYDCPDFYRCQTACEHIRDILLWSSFCAVAITIVLLIWWLCHLCRRAIFGKR
ncbi:MAG: type II secretion system protein GspG [Pseudomonadota bacterium]